MGATLAEQWKLPRAVAAVIRGHHDPQQSCRPDHQRIIDLVHVADGLAHSLGYGSALGELARHVDPQASRRLGVDARVLERIASDTMDQIWEMTGVLDQTLSVAAG